jgi:putative phosphoesterase
MKVAVLSDTHAPRFWKACPAAVARRLEGADLILHAGDVCRAWVLEELAAFAPVRAVLGNNDDPDVAAWGAPETLGLDLDGLAVAMVHDAGPAAGRLERLRRRFPDIQAVVFGHSHMPLLELDRDGRFAIFNPGSPTERRRSPHHTMGVATAADGRVAFELVTLGH